MSQVVLMSCWQVGAYFTAKSLLMLLNVHKNVSLPWCVVLYLQNDVVENKSLSTEGKIKISHQELKTILMFLCNTSTYYNLRTIIFCHYLQEWTLPVPHIQNMWGDQAEWVSCRKYWFWGTSNNIMWNSFCIFLFSATQNCLYLWNHKSNFYEVFSKTKLSECFYK